MVSQFIFLYDLPQEDGKPAGHWLWGTALYTAVLATVLGKAALVTKYVSLPIHLRAPLGFAADGPPNSLWTKYAVMAIPGSMVIWMAVMPVYSIVAPKLGFSTEYFGIIGRLISSPVFWGMAIVLPCLCLMRDFAWKYAKRMYYPQTYHHIQEIQKYNIQDYRPRYVSRQKSRGVMLMTFFQDGTIPEGNKKSPASTEDAETAWICVFTSRRGCNPVDPSLRHHQREGQVWGNAKCGCSIQMMINTKLA